MNQEKASQSGKRPDREQNTTRTTNNSRRGSNHKGGGPKVPRAAMVPNNKEKKPPHCGEGSNKVLFEEQVVDKIEEIKAEMANGDPDPGGGGKKVMGILEQQSSLIRRQRDDIEDLRKKLEDNAKLADVFKGELDEIRKKVQDSGTKTNGTIEANGKDEAAPKEEGTLKAKVDSLTAAYNDIQDRLYEIDKSWKNNLVVYGIAAESSNEEDPAITEEKVISDLSTLYLRHVMGATLFYFRSETCFTRNSTFQERYPSAESPGKQENPCFQSLIYYYENFAICFRIWHGPDFRGHKPIQVCIVNYRDKEEILRKARLLKGSNIYVSEDFSRKVREHRHELIKFMKEVSTVLWSQYCIIVVMCLQYFR